MRQTLALQDEVERVRHPLSRRAVSFILAAAITALILLVLLGLNGGSAERPRFRGQPILVTLSPDSGQAPKTERKAVAKNQPRPSPETPAPPPPAKAVPPPPVAPPPVPAPHAPNFIVLSKEDYAASDITNKGVAFGTGRARQQATASDDSAPVGTAPDGEPLYAARWYREPTRAELEPYLPPVMPAEGFGLIACKTVERYHVDDCVELASRPAGSHLAGAARQAAWQFLVRPPRLGGKDLIGAWVQIQINYRPRAQD